MSYTLRYMPVGGVRWKHRSQGPKCGSVAPKITKRQKPLTAERTSVPLRVSLAERCPETLKAPAWEPSDNAAGISPALTAAPLTETIPHGDPQ